MNEAAWEQEIAKRDEIIRRQADEIAALTKQGASLQQKVSELTSLLQEKASTKDAKKPKFAEDYSLDRQERKKSRRRKKKSTGRKPTQAKQHLIQQTENVYPQGVPSRRCELTREQCAWRLKDGRAVYVCYRIFRERGTETLPQVFGLRNTRCEFGLEIHVVLAFLVYQIGVSIDQAREILRFFTRLDMSKSQADSLLNQLATDWGADFDALCGKGRGGDVLDSILPKNFAGIGVTDNYAAYENRFAKHQKCWAHLLRKIISLMLRFPEKPEYHAFFEELYAIYGEGVRCQKDRRLSASRSERVVRLPDRIRRLCTRTDRIVWKEMPDEQQRFLKLQNELLSCLDNLFVFVEHPEVEATNNRSERQARGQAQARKASRTSKTERGAKRRSIITSVLGSLQQCLAEFSIDSVLEEVGRWCSTGISRFRSQLPNPRASPQPALAPS